MTAAIRPPLFAGPASRRLPGVSLDWSARLPAARVQPGVPLFVGFVRAHEEAARPQHRVAAAVLERWEAWPAGVEAPALGYLDYAVKGFFENGGRRCWIWPLAVAANASADELQRLLTTCFAAGSPLEDVSEPDLLCVPDAGFGPLADDAEAVHAVQHAALAYCHRMADRFVLLDCMPHRGTEPRGRVARLAAHDGSHPGDAANGAVYWPWIVVLALPRHALRGNATLAVPPCGHVAGMMARLDAATGRHKAPANETLEGAVDVDEHADDTLLADLHDEGVNGLRVLSGRGVRVCSARTLSELPAWRHVNVRRVVLGLARWAEFALSDLVMDTNNPALWERLRQRVVAWCLARYHEGALQGDSPDDAYVVKCDAETNTPDARETGRVVCEVSLAVTTPAEFIVVQLIQSADGAGLAD